MMHLVHYDRGSAVGKSNMFSAVILAFTVLATRVESGLYHYRKHIYNNQEPNYPSVAYNVPHRGDLANEVPDKSVSYSISANDYNYLKLFTNGQQDSQYSSYNVVGGAAAVTSRLPCKKYLADYNNIVSNEASGIATHQDFVNWHSPVYTPLAVQPIIKKHIYFHVPPPETEEKPVVVREIQPPKKTYNILFIKIPAQEINYARHLKDLLRNRLSNVEEKTIIYVLVKKPEQQPVSVPEPPKTSEHEVFYVKYKDSPGAVAAQIKDSLGDTHVDEVASVLDSVDVRRDAPLNSKIVTGVKR